MRVALSASWVLSAVLLTEFQAASNAAPLKLALNWRDFSDSYDPIPAFQSPVLIDARDTETDAVDKRDAADFFDHLEAYMGSNGSPVTVDARDLAKRQAAYSFWEDLWHQSESKRDLASFFHDVAVTMGGNGAPAPIGVRDLAKRQWITPWKGPNYTKRQWITPDDGQALPKRQFIPEDEFIEETHDEEVDHDELQRREDK